MNIIITLLFFVGIGLVILLTCGKTPKELIFTDRKNIKKDHGWSEHIKRAQGRIK